MGWKDAPMVDQSSSAASAPRWSSAPVVNTKRKYDPFADDESALPPLPGEDVEDAYPERREQSSYFDRIGRAAHAPIESSPLTQLFGVGEAGATLATGMAAPAVAGFKGMLTGKEPTNEDVSRFTYEPRTDTGKALVGLAGTAAEPAAEFLQDTGADVALLPLTIEAQALRRAPTAKPAPGPSKEALRTATDAAYDAARASNVVYRPQALMKLRGRVESLLRREGFDRDLHPDTAAVVRRLSEQEAAGQPLGLDEMENLRRVALNAEGAQKPGDRRLASLVVDEIDDVTDELGAADTFAGDSEQAQAILRQARDYHTRVKKSDEIDELIRRAELSAPNFSASGMENALRTEFRALAKNQKRMRRFSPEERAAIERVAKGDLPTNALRMLGKFAPTGAVSTGISSGVGFMAGGPAGALGVPAAGLASRVGATALTKRAANRAGEIMRGEPLEPLQQPSAAAPAVLAAMEGELVPRAQLALPAPNIVAGSRSAPGTAYAREQMGITPDVERSGALHPGAPRESLMPRQPGLPNRAAPTALTDQRPMVVDLAGRVAKTREQLDAYLEQTGQARMRNVRKPNVGAMPQRIGEALDRVNQPPAIRSMERIRADLARLDSKIQKLPPNEPFDSLRAQALEAEYSRLREELAAAANPRASAPYSAGSRD